MSDFFHLHLQCSFKTRLCSSKFKIPKPGNNETAGLFNRLGLGLQGRRRGSGKVGLGRLENQIPIQLDSFKKVEALVYTPSVVDLCIPSEINGDREGYASEQQSPVLELGEKVDIPGD